MKKIIYLFLFFLYAIQVFAQETSASPAKASESISWYKKNVFFSWGLSPVLQDVYLEKFTYLRTDSFHYYGDTAYIKVKVLGRMSGFPFLSFNFHARINIKNISDHASYSINVPAALGVGVVEADTKREGEKTLGTQMPFSEIISAHIHLPLFVCYNRGYHSTYNNIDSKGYYYGVGGQFTIAPVVSSKKFKERGVDPFIFIPGIACGYKSPILNKKQGVEFFVGFVHGFFLRISAVHVIGYKEK
jgi:hypothetical protein